MIESKIYLVRVYRESTNSSIELTETIELKNEAGYCPRGTLIHRLKKQFPGWKIKIVGTFVKETRE